MRRENPGGIEVFFLLLLYLKKMMNKFNTVLTIILGVVLICSTRNKKLNKQQYMFNMILHVSGFPVRVWW